MSLLTKSTSAMSTKEVWFGIVKDCLSDQKTINVGGRLRRISILTMNNRLIAWQRALAEISSCTSIIAGDVVDIARKALAQADSKEVSNVETIDEEARQGRNR